MNKAEEQILKNQIVIMGMLQNLQDDFEPIKCIEETHNLIIEERKKMSSCLL